ncbi:sensor histidine kinase [Nitriliruptor alkaliphilus]|uniref:sensor histidine kinase n=1 Tax=Nitriliruptor alkaliphilus TaxID=427918 RepID=UPI000698F1FC|nr:ATP-binding protein [Nitriliruptor alkaliphilus]
MDLLGTLQWIQALLFTGLGLVALRAYLRQRTRPAAYVAGAFGALAFVTLGTRLTELIVAERPDLFQDAMVLALLAFPWLLAAMVWSFEGPLPRWLRLAGVATAALGLTVLPLPSFGDAERSTAQALFVAGLLIQWVFITGTAAGHLWRVGRGQRVVRARTRLIAGGAIVLAGALLVAGTVDRADRPGLATGIALLVIVAALLFAAGVAPPALLRWYWRQLPGQRMHEMQTALVAAATPDEVAHAVTPVLGDTFGAGSLCADPSGRIVAAHAMSTDEAERVLAGIIEDEPSREDVRALTVDGWWLAVHASPYAPLFGEDERGLLERFGAQFRLALQRAELFVAHQRDKAELERAGAEMQSMLVGLSHDLRSPAVTISTYASLLREARDADDREQMITGIRDSSAYLDRLVDGLLELSRIGRSDGEPEPVALHAVIDGVQRRLAATHPSLTVEVHTDLPTLCVDRLRIEQVIDNLLGNAAKHGGRQDLTIDVSWEPNADGGTLVLTDDGRGVPDREREAVFALFRRGSGASVSGSGVGLGLVRRIVESYDGRIAFAPSETGARVELELPAELLQPEGSASPGLPQVVSPPHP